KCLAIRCDRLCRLVGRPQNVAEIVMGVGISRLLFNGCAKGRGRFQLSSLCIEHESATVRRLRVFWISGDRLSQKYSCWSMLTTLILDGPKQIERVDITRFIS